MRSLSPLTRVGARPQPSDPAWDIWKNNRWNPSTSVQIAKSIKDGKWSLDFKPKIKASLSTVGSRKVAVIRVDRLGKTLPAPKGKSLQELLQEQTNKEAALNKKFGLAVPDKQLMSIHSPRDGIAMDEQKAPIDEAILVPIGTIGGGGDEKEGDLALGPLRSGTGVEGLLIDSVLTPRTGVVSMIGRRQFSVQTGDEMEIDDEDADMRDVEPELPPTPRTPFDPARFPMGDPNVTIRASIPRDRFQVKRCHAKAFNDPQEAVFIETLTNARQVKKQFVGVLPSNRSEGGDIIAGAISFVECRVERTMRGCEVKGICLKRLAVHPMYQRRGIGKSLMRVSLTEIQKEGYDFVIVLGHTSYYTKFGFEPAQSWGLSTDYKADEAFLALEITPHIRKKIFGKIGLWPRW